MPTPQERLRTLYGFDFPDDFFIAMEFLKRAKQRLLKACDISPAFPFAAATGKKPSEHPKNPLWEDRYYHDLPEFITLFFGHIDGLHFGYVFDSPGELAPIVASYYHSDTFEHSFVGNSLLEALRFIIEEAEVDCLEMMEEDPDEEAEYRRQLKDIAHVRTMLGEYWGANRTKTGDAYLEHYSNAPRRKPIAHTWDHLGIVVSKKQYRPLSADPFAGIQVKLTRPQVLALIKEAHAQLEAGHAGAALKLGRDLWCWARDYPECYDLLDAAYAALGREPLRRLLTAARTWREHCDAQRA